GLLTRVELTAEIGTNPAVFEYSGAVITDLGERGPCWVEREESQLGIGADVDDPGVSIGSRARRDSARRRDAVPEASYGVVQGRCTVLRPIELAPVGLEHGDRVPPRRPRWAVHEKNPGFRGPIVGVDLAVLRKGIDDSVLVAGELGGVGRDERGHLC